MKQSYPCILGVCPNPERLKQGSITFCTCRKKRAYNRSRRTKDETILDFVSCAIIVGTIIVVLLKLFESLL